MPEVWQQYTGRFRDEKRKGLLEGSTEVGRNRTQLGRERRRSLDVQVQKYGCGFWCDPLWL